MHVALLWGMRNLLVVGLLASCATTLGPLQPIPPTGSRDPRASDDIATAHVKDERARELLAYPEVPRGDGTGRVTELAPATPWAVTWQVKEQRQEAAAARGAAAALEAEYEEACGSRSHDEVAVSPLQRFGVGGTTTPTGVTVELSADAGPADRLLADMRCHRAWMMLGRTDMDDCPLDLAGIAVNAHGDGQGISVEISVRDPALVPELQRRAARDLEQAAKLHRVAR